MIAASGSRRGLWVLVAGVCICGCSRSEPLLVSGTTVRDLVSDDSTIVVLYDPARCLSCDPNMLMWQGLKVKDPDAVRLILNRRPTRQERRQIELLGFAFDGVLDQTKHSKTTLLLYVDGHVVVREESRVDAEVVNLGRRLLRE
jgi:hypothetical protein